MKVKRFLAIGAHVLIFLVLAAWSAVLYVATPPRNNNEIVLARDTETIRIQKVENGWTVTVKAEVWQQRDWVTIGYVGDEKTFVFDSFGEAMNFLEKLLLEEKERIEE